MVAMAFHSVIIVFEGDRIPWSKEGTVKNKETSILLSQHEETRELPEARDNARNNARCMQARKTTHDLDGQHQDVDRTRRGRVNQNDREWRKYVHVWPTLGSRTAKEQNRTAFSL